MFYGNKRYSKYKKIRLKVQAVQLFYGLYSNNNMQVQILPLSEVENLNFKLHCYPSLKIFKIITKELYKPVKRNFKY